VYFHRATSCNRNLGFLGLCASQLLYR
jgi:hypothetical protein